MRHNIMANLVLVCGCGGVINIVYVRPHFGDLLLRYRNTKLAFAFRKGNPKLPPGGEFAVVGKNALHLLAGIAGAKRVYIKFVVCHK